MGWYGVVTGCPGVLDVGLGPSSDPWILDLTASNISTGRRQETVVRADPVHAPTDVAPDCRTAQRAATRGIDWRLPRLRSDQFAGLASGRPRVLLLATSFVLAGALSSCREEAEIVAQTLRIADVESVFPWADAIGLLTNGRVRVASVFEGVASAITLGAEDVVAVDPTSKSILCGAGEGLFLRHGGSVFAVPVKTSTGSWAIAGTGQAVTLFRDGRPFLEHSARGWSDPNDALVRAARSTVGKEVAWVHSGSFYIAAASKGEWGTEILDPTMREPIHWPYPVHQIDAVGARVLVLSDLIRTAYESVNPGATKLRPPRIRPPDQSRFRLWLSVGLLDRGSWSKLPRDWTSDIQAATLDPSGSLVAIAGGAMVLRAADTKWLMELTVERADYVMIAATRSEIALLDSGGVATIYARGHSRPSRDEDQISE